MKDCRVVYREEFKKPTDEGFVNVVLGSLNSGKQILVFNNSKSNSEATAEKISQFVSDDDFRLRELSDKILKSLHSPTKQCVKLANLVRKGVAFHHSGLVAKQRMLVERGFKEGVIKVISSTPTLAAGLNLPAYKVIVKDYKRYSSRGFNDIPVLEFHQMSGRAGRPGKESVGKAVLCVKSEDELERVVPKYIFGEAEEIVSKLAVEPTLKMYILSLVAMDVVNSEKEIEDFFSNTLYAFQYRDLEGLFNNIFRILGILREQGFVERSDDYFVATPIGKKVSELYLNPDTAYYFLKHVDVFFDRFSKSSISKSDYFSLVYFVVSTMEMRPLFRVYRAEQEKYVEMAQRVQEELLVSFNPFEMDYGHFLDCLKTSEVLMDWIGEAPESYMSDKYRVTPGELGYKLEVVDWLLYCLEEISLMKRNFYFRNFLNKLRLRFKKGVREELLHFVALRGIGRVRARKLFSAGFKKIGDLRMADLMSLSRILGEGVAVKVKEQVETGEGVEEGILKGKPKEIKVREVSDEEVEQILESVNTYEREKEEKNRKLSEFF